MRIRYNAYLHAAALAYIYYVSVGGMVTELFRRGAGRHGEALYGSR